MFDIDYTLNIFKCKNVKTPSKAWDAAGWDFYVPENLSIFDFTKTYKTYLNENIVHDKTLNYEVPLIFYMKSERTVGEYPIKLILTWNETLKEYVFNLCEYSKNDFNIISFETIDNKIIQWVTEDTTIISKIEVLPGGNVLIPSGIHVNLPKDVFLKAENKSGIASKRSLLVGASVIDVDYHGEIHINLINASNNNVIINAGDKIVQFVRYFQPKMNNINEFKSLDDLYKGSESKRGEGGFGSSGTK